MAAGNATDVREYDLALLLCLDTAPVDITAKDPMAFEDKLKELTEENTQALFDKLFSLPIQTNDDGVFAVLPEQTTLIPRAKPVPSDKAMTRWEKFAKAKGIQKKSRSRKEYDEAKGEYRPRYGYAGKDDSVPDDWLMEVPGSADPMENQHQKAKAEKQARVSKNKQKQSRNISESNPAFATLPTNAPREVKKETLKKAIVETKTSTASIGKFDEAIKGEKAVKIKRQKRKFEPDTPANPAAEQEKVKNVVSKVLKKEAEGGVITSKAVSFAQQESEKKPMKKRAKK
ncbi:Rhodanese- sulfurtransferase [Chytridiales sp. JEL 0842]|nr:Rhodanese- sulfurtransferase [Chytridiales sp. JEL 0842]